MLVHCLYYKKLVPYTHKHTHQTIGVKEAKHKDGIFFKQVYQGWREFKNFFAKSVPVEYIKNSTENIISMII